MRVFNYLILMMLLGSILGACQGKTQSVDWSKMTFDQLNQHIAKDSTDDIALRYRAYLQAQSGNIDAAIVDLSKAFTYSPDSIQYQLQISDWYLRKGNITQSLQLLNELTTQKPEYTDAWIKLGEIHLIFKKYDDAIKYANQGLESNPYSDKALFLKAYCFKELGDTAKAIAQFQDCVKNNPKNYEANIELGILNMKQSIGEQYFKNAIAIDSNRIDGWYDLGMFYQQNDMLNEAIEAYKILGQRHPQFPHSFFNVGYIYMQTLNIPDKAVPYFENACKIKPNYYEAWFNLGLTYEKMGDVLKAEKAYQQALIYKPDYEAAQEALQRIKS